MNFCYIHPTEPAEGKCFECGNWICIHDYNLLEEEFGEGRKHWYSRKTVDDEPVVLCPNCYKKDTHHAPENLQAKDNELIHNPVHNTKVLMCFQCGAKITEKDKICPVCGESTEDEDYDATHPLGGYQSSEKDGV